MQYQILVQSQSDRRFTASVLGLPDCVVEGGTEEEAMEKVRGAIEDKLAQSKIVTIEIGAPQEPANTLTNPWLRSAGSFKDDPTFDEVMKEIARCRAELDAEAGNETTFSAVAHE